MSGTRWSPVEYAGDPTDLQLRRVINLDDLVRNALRSDLDSLAVLSRRTFVLILALIATAGVVAGIVVWTTSSRSNGSPAHVAYLREAWASAPSAYNSDYALLNVGRTVCENDRAGKSNPEIVNAIVEASAFGNEFAGTGKVTPLEASRFSTVALQHCAYLASPEAARMLAAAELEQMQEDRERLIQLSVDRGWGTREQATENVDRMIADARARAGNG
jgi:hypothetical protein